MSEKASEKSEESAKQVQELVEKFSAIHRNYVRLSKRTVLIKAFEAIINLMIEAGLLEERAKRHMRIVIDDEEGSVFIHPEELRRWARPKMSDELRETSNWLMTTSRKELEAEGFTIHDAIIWLDLIQVTPGVEAEISRLSNFSKETVYKEVPQVITDFITRLCELGFDRIGITSEENQSYRISASQILARNESAILLAQFNTSIWKQKAKDYRDN